MSSLLVATTSEDELFQLNHASGSSKQGWHIPDAMCTVSELLMVGGETAWNMYSINSNKEYCITLHLVGYTYKEYINDARSHERQTYLSLITNVGTSADLLLCSVIKS